MQRTFLLAVALSIAAHVAAIGVYAPDHRARAEPKSKPTLLTKLTLRGTRSASPVTTHIEAAIALPSIAAAVADIAPIATPPHPPQPSTASVRLAPPEPADIAPPTEPTLVSTTLVSGTLVSTTLVPGIALPRLGIASPFGGPRRASHADFAMQSAALAYAQQREAAMDADAHAHLAAAAAMAAMTTAHCDPAARTDCPAK